MWRKDAAKCAKDATMRTKNVVMCGNDAAMCATHPRRITKECCPCAFFSTIGRSSLRRDLFVVLRASDPDHRF